MAPEIISRSSYQGQVVDLFASAVILFILYAQHPPFINANPKDTHYKLLATNRSDLFWKAHSNSKAPGFFSNDFKDLITCMLQVHPHQRLSMADIIGHPWLAGPTATKEEVMAEFAKRHAQIKKEKEIEQARKDALKAQRAARAGGAHRGESGDQRVYMSGSAQIEEESKNDYIYLQLGKYEPGTYKTTQIMTKQDPGVVFSAIIDELTKTDTAFSVDDKKFKITYTKAKEQEVPDEESKDEEEFIVPMPEQVSLAIRLLKVNEEQTCIDISRTKGSAMFFFEEANSLKENLLDFNDE